jgi:large subunit ribosomal protein L5
MNKPFLKSQYEEIAIPELKKKFGYVNQHEVPRLIKVVINHGFNASVEKAQIDEALKEISNIACQKAVIRLSRKSISNFKLRENQPIGIKVTLRGSAMYEFLLRMIAVALPGIRDFRGVPAKLDGHGNYTLGITDHTIFPESHGDHAKKALGMDITIVTSAKTDDEGRELLSLLGMPFRKRTAAAAATTTAA